MASVTDTQVITHRFGDIAKAMGLVDEAQIEEALRKQMALRASGDKSRLGEVFILMHVLNVEQVRKVLSEQRKRRTAEADKALPAEHFGEYKLLEKLGEGGMGSVFKAQETLAGRTVALKVLRKNLAGNPNFVARFDREAKLAGTLSHPNIVACYAAGTSRGVQFLAMEFVDGETLKARLIREMGKLPEPEALRIIRDAALGLAHAHEKGVVHRDIKPDNILLGRDGSVKISDFGTAKSFLDDESLTKTGVIVGTPYYISPEQVRGDKDIDHRADLYALGASMYQTLTGRLPFNAPTGLQVMRAHLEDELENPADINPQLSAGAVQIVTKLMAKQAAQRYQNAADLAKDIGRVRDGQAPLHATLEQFASSIRAPQRAAGQSKSKKGCMGMLLLLAAALAVASRV